MSKTNIKKAMLLLAMGGATFAFAFPFWGGASFVDTSCVRNSDLVNFYQAVGNAGIAEYTDTVRNTMPFPVGGDFDNVVVGPTQGFLSGLWNNFVAQRFPLDLDTTGVVRQ
jgi:hypothetical protein